jgi:2-C-methyl-D-erythritol 4-phosphate cytidylyltransferase/2-C-methyl-D-erythritol 2,4-cyclodiphosphate synthase
VIVVAAGRGERLGGDVPKQLLDIGGTSILRRSVDAFAGLDEVSELVVVLPGDLVERGVTLVGPASRPARFVAGGPRRQDSVRLGFEALSAQLDLVLVHDAARPFVDAGLIARVIDAARETGAAVPAVPARDTIKQVEQGTSLVRRTIPRGEIWLTQTPQGFRRAVLADAVARGREAADATDEAMLVEAGGGAVKVVMGDEGNVKITTADDLAAARRRVSAAPRVGTGYDLHRLIPGRALVLAGVDVGGDVGPDSHSDCDVVCHALVDAMFGAAAAGDIGTHFPNTDPAWKDAPGLDLLGRSARILADLGWQTASADVTVVLERPKLGPHVAAIREALAGVLGVLVSAVSVKAKTNEGVDAVGRGDAIAAHAVAVVHARGEA